MKNNNRFSVKEYLRELFLDEHRRKALLVGIAVFVIVFVGLTLYQHALDKRQGDVIVTNGAGETGQGAEGANGPDSPEGMSSEEVNGSETANDEEGKVDGADGTGGSSPGETGQSAEQAAIFVDVGGAVQISGLFALPPGSRVADAIEAAGGLSEEAEVKYINRAALLFDGDRLYIPTETEVKNGTAPPTAGQVSASGGYSGGTASPSPGGGAASPSTGGGAENPQAGEAKALVNINTAGSDELQKLSGVGPVTAQKIIDYREKRGGFKRIEDLMNVNGIGAKTFQKLKEHITV